VTSCRDEKYKESLQIIKCPNSGESLINTLEGKTPQEFWNVAL
jgi:hypothetical protein